MTGLWLISYVALWLLFLLVGIILLSTLHNLGVLYNVVERINQDKGHSNFLEKGKPLPEVALQTLFGDAIQLPTLGGVRTAFSVVSPGCGACHTLLEAIAQGKVAPDPLDSKVQRRIILSMGSITQTEELVSHASLKSDVIVLVDEGAEIGQKWGINSTPATVIVDEHLNVVRHSVGFKMPAILTDSTAEV